MTKRNDRGGPPADKQRLSRDAWLDAAAGAIASGGFDNVRVLVLAKQLGVSRGSFYWHFRDHRDLIEGFLRRWRDRRLAELEYLREYLHTNTSGSERGLRRALELVLSEAGRDMRRLRVALAIRDYARRDPFAASIVAEVDRARLAHNEQMLSRFTTNAEESRDLALLLYLTIVGGQLTVTSGEGELSVQRLEELVTTLVRRWLAGAEREQGHDVKAP